MAEPTVAHVKPMSNRVSAGLILGWVILSAWFVWAAATGRLPEGWLTQGWIEAIGITTSILFAWLEVRESVWNWPVAIVASIAYIEYFRRSGYFANMWLQLYYVVISVLGWYWWVRGGERKSALPIVRAKLKTWLVFGLIVAVAVPVTEALMLHFRDPGEKFDKVGFTLDVVTAVLSIGGEVLLGRKIIENWWIWILVNALTVYMLRGSPFSAGLYAFFFVLSVLGLVEWRRARAVGDAVCQN